MSCKRCGEARVRIRIDLATTLLCTKYRVAESLCCLVGKLAGAERFQPRLSLVERTLCSAAGAVELFLQLVDESHCRLLLK